VFEETFRRLAQTYVTRRYLESTEADEGFRKCLLVDTSFVKNQYGRTVLGPNPTDRGRKATKVSLLTDINGVPLQVNFHPGNRHDSQTLPHLLQEASRHLGNSMTAFTGLIADKGYDSHDCRTACRMRGLRPHFRKKEDASRAQKTILHKELEGLLNVLSRA